MGTYVNPENNAFKEIIASGFVDKSMMISDINKTLETRKKETVFTRPRRFGKTTAAIMLAAYYSCGCDSRNLFNDLLISKDENYEEHLNKHPVIFFDLMRFMNNEKVARKNVVKEIQDRIKKDLMKEYPEADVSMDISVQDCMDNVIKYNKMKGKDGKFIVIIDEWDMILREEKDNLELQKEYISFLRSLFRDAGTADYLSGAYMTGILPIIKYNTESALSDFWEYTMVDPMNLGEYIGFKEEEVKHICNEYPKSDFEEMKKWYDGYYIEDVGHIYCPNSVMKAAPMGRYNSYWASTSAFESLKYYIELNFDGLKQAIEKMLDGEEYPVNTSSFQNNLNQIKDRDDVMTILVHLGYLAYDSVRKTVRIPNLEIRQTFLNTIKSGNSQEFINRIKRCEEAIQATMDEDEERLADIVRQVHATRPPRHYNNEQSLRTVILNTYDYTPMCYYTTFEELSSGQGYCDILCMPQLGIPKPPIVVELKWNRDAETAIEQIKKKNYVDFLKKIQYKGDALLVGINYDPDTKEHTCNIEAIIL